jgi:eukaryotic-like serine/threonine-protein kinase
MRTRFVHFLNLVILLIVILTACGPSATPVPTELPPTATPVPPSATSAPPTETSTPTIVPTPTLGIGSTVIGKDGMTLVYVPEGEFLMGSADTDRLAQDIEKPQHTVFLDAYWIDQTEVTNKQFRDCIVAGACEERPFTNFWESYLNDAEFDDYPTIYVSWDNAQAYCTWAGRRLPTEAEWEKAARGTDGRIYPWGDEGPNDDLLTFAGVFDTPLAVKSHPGGVSPYGVYDMAGNVWEPVSDWFDYEYYSNSPLTNPTGPDSGNRHTVRGGGFRNGDQYVRSAYRLRPYSNQAFNDGGVRCALSASQ